jgi:hypothetical protein
MRIAPKPAQACPWYLRPFCWNQRRKYGKLLDAALLWARAEAVHGHRNTRRDAVDGHRRPELCEA